LLCRHAVVPRVVVLLPPLILGVIVRFIVLLSVAKFCPLMGLPSSGQGLRVAIVEGFRSSSFTSSASVGAGSEPLAPGHHCLGL
jgi:hypothetical protein